MRLRIFLLIILALVSFTPIAFADNFSSTNFTLKDPVIAEPAAYGTSSSFGLWGIIPNIASVNGTSTNFGVNPGFLAFSGVVMPTLSATASATEIDASWTAAQGTNTVTYEPGYALVSGGPYTFAAPQLGLTATIGSLTEDTAYYLIVRVKEQSGGVLLGYSNELAISTLSSSEEIEESEETTTGSEPLVVSLWVLGPDGLVPLAADDMSEYDGETLLSGESVTTQPPLFRQFGYVMGRSGDEAVPVAGARVLVERFDPVLEIYAPWPNTESALVFTDTYGMYSFLLPEGRYRLVVEADDYLRYRGGVSVVNQTGDLEQYIELAPSLSFDIPSLPLMLLVLLALLITGFTFFGVVHFLMRK